MVCHEQALAEQEQLCKKTNTQPTSKLRVPRQNGDLLITPDMRLVPETLEFNRSIFTQVNASSLLLRRRQTQRETLELARKFTTTICPTAPPCQQCSIDEMLQTKTLFVTGHQPEIFHPGVWVKNVLVDKLAREQNGIAINIVIDSDALKSNSISIPSFKNKRFVSQKVAIDNWTIGLPWEELQTQDEAFFTSFAQRTQELLAKLNGNSVFDAYWQHVVTATKKTNSIVTGLICGRVQMERKLGINNLELPVSQLAKTDSFQNFLVEIILRAEQLQTIYNCSLSQYRNQYRIKSEMQPVPNLIEEQGWRELPIWVWQPGSIFRRSLFVKKQNGELLFSDRKEWNVSIKLDESEDQFAVVTGFLNQLQNEGIRFRTKALMTTAFLRVFLADLFIHGIGGAKYDEITDLIIEKFYGIAAPKFQIATGTLHLSIKEKPVKLSVSSQKLKQQIRYANENPEFLMSDSQKQQVAALLIQKHNLIQQQNQAATNSLTRTERRAKTPGNKRRHQQLKQVRRTLLNLVASELKQLENQLNVTLINEKNLAITNSREYPLCCFPLETLQSFKNKIETHQ